MLLLLLSCAADCPPGSVLGDDGLCHLPALDSASSDTPDSADSADSADTAEPLLSPPPAGPWDTITTGGFHGCVLSGTTPACWGYDAAGQASPPDVALTAISAGLMHTCGLTAEGAVVCWGDDTHGQSSPPEGTFISVSAGMMHSCGVTAEGVLTCWGSDIVGQSSPPEDTYTAVTAGGYISAGITTEGVLRCFGEFDNCIQEDIPDVHAASAGYQHLIALTGQGVVCGGFDGEGRCPEPDAVLLSVSAGGYHSCGLVKDSGLRCWPGTNISDEQVWPEGDFIAVSAGFQMSCALDDAGEIRCWSSDGSPL
jgi:hypothetical protein